MNMKVRIRTFLRKRSVKLALLVVTAIIISTAGTTVFFSLQSASNIEVSEAPVHFTAGDDSTAAGYTPGTNETYASLSGLKAYPNVTLTYEQAMNLTNADTGAHDVRLRHITITPSSGSDPVGNYTQIDFILIDTSGTPRGTLTYTTTGDNWDIPSSTSYVSIPAGEEWRVQVQTKAVAGAKKSLSCVIEVAVDVQ